MLDLAVVILTYNEELHLDRALESIQDIAREIFIIDSFSTDRTLDIAHAKNAVVLQNKWTNHAKQFAWGMENAPITASWIMRLDADEIIEPDLQAEIRKKLPALGPDVVGINLKRKHIFLNRWIRHGGRYPLILTRIWRRGHGQIEDRWMDEHIFVSGGSTITFNGGFADHNLNDLTFFTDKHNNYATREAVDVLIKRYKLFEANSNAGGATAADSHNSKQAVIKRWIKENIYNKLPFWAGPLGYFTYRMTIQLGFLDGKEGLIYHFLQGFWYRFLVGAKILEFDREIQRLPTAADKLAALRKASGLNL